MIRNTKAFGLSLVAISAFAAISASAASAVTEPIAHFTASQYPAHVTGERLGETMSPPPVSVITCETAHFDGTPINQPSTSLTVHPTYEECDSHNPVSGKTTSVTITTNGCYYTFTVHKFVGEEETVNGTVDDNWSGDTHLTCPEGIKGIEFHVYKDKEHTQLICSYTAKPQTVTEIDYTVHTEAGKATSITAELPEKSILLNKTTGTFMNCEGLNQAVFLHQSIGFTMLSEENSPIEGSIGKVTT